MGNHYYLAVDIGASSGRHILGKVNDGKIITQEIHRFENSLKEKNGQLSWDIDKLFLEIKAGMKKCKEIGKIPISMGIDTWGVDFVLLDEANQRLGNAVSYRDRRTNRMDELVYQYISEIELYQRTGIQKQLFNTIYQLMALKEKQPELLNRAETMLLIPDYFHYLLTGEKAAEYTNATTTQLIAAGNMTWDMELIDLLGYPKRIFPKVHEAGTILGTLLPEIAGEVGFQCMVILPATHDTGSAVVAVPSNEEQTLYLSSGTWSLMGIERKAADCSKESRLLNFTNEGGYQYRYRYLKNIMGLWMIQCLKRELDEKYSFAELCAMAEKESISSRVDCNGEDFLAPVSMIQAIQAYCRSTRQEMPETPAQLAHVIYASLAECYQKTIEEIENQMNCRYDKLYIVGGGANVAYLNKLTAQVTGKLVLAGPDEATAYGNLMVQMLANKEWKNLREARQCLYETININKYEKE